MIPVLAVVSEWHIILVLIILFLLFGGKKLPELARGIGEALKQFKKAQRDLNTDDHRPADAPNSPNMPRPDATPTTASAPAPKPTDSKLN